MKTPILLIAVMFFSRGAVADDLESLRAALGDPSSIELASAGEGSMVIQAQDGTPIDLGPLPEPPAELGCSEADPTPGRRWLLPGTPPTALQLERESRLWRLDAESGCLKSWPALAEDPGEPVQIERVEPEVGEGDEAEVAKFDMDGVSVQLILSSRAVELHPSAGGDRVFGDNLPDEPYYVEDLGIVWIHRLRGGDWLFHVSVGGGNDGAGADHEWDSDYTVRWTPGQPGARFVGERSRSDDEYYSEIETADFSEAEEAPPGHPCQSAPLGAEVLRDREVRRSSEFQHELGAGTLVHRTLQSDERQLFIDEVTSCGVVRTAAHASWSWTFEGLDGGASPVAAYAPEPLVSSVAVELSVHPYQSYRLGEVRLDESAALALADGEVHGSEWTPVASGAPPVAANLRPGDPLRIRRDGRRLQLLDGEGRVVDELLTGPDSAVFVGDVLDQTGRRGQALDEIVAVAPWSTTTVYAYDWGQARTVRALTLPPIEAYECGDLDLDTHWGAIVFPGPTGGTALLVGPNTRLAYWNGERWCGGEGAWNREPRPVETVDGQRAPSPPATWSLNVDGDEIADQVVLEGDAIEWRLSGASAPLRQELEPLPLGHDPIVRFSTITYYDAAPRIFVAEREFESDPAGGANGSSEVRVFGLATDRPVEPLIDVQSRWQTGEMVSGPCGGGEVTRRTLTFQVLGTLALILKETIEASYVFDADCAHPTGSGRLSRSWFYLGDGALLDIDHNYWSRPLTDADLAERVDR